MVNVTRRVSFSVVIALLFGWGAMSVMIVRSNEYLLTAETPDSRPLRLPSGIRLSLLVDKQIYRQSEPILLSLRNDSRLPVWLAVNAGGCPQSWWILQRLGAEENDWETISRRKEDCHGPSTGIENMAKGTLKTDEWNGLLQTDAIGEVFTPATIGTYRVAVPFLRGKNATEGDWQQEGTRIATTPFTIQ